MPAGTLQDVLGFTTVAATTAGDVAASANLPFLGGAATLTLSIVQLVKCMSSAGDKYSEIMEQIHEIFSAIIMLYETTQIDGILSPTFLSEIAKFAESLCQIHVYLKAKEGMGKLKRFLNILGSEVQLDICKIELKKTLETFRLHRGVSQVTAISGVRMNAEQTHQELLVFLAAHPDITNSDSSSSVSVALSGPTNSSESITFLPPVPKIFHGRESELEEVVGLLKQDSPRISILGPGGVGKTSLALAALHHDEVVIKYPQRYFVSCNSCLTCADLIAAISSHVGFTQVKSSRGIHQHFVCSEASFLVLDNLETTWEPKLSRSEVEQFLSLLADVPQLALLITMRGTEKPARVKWTRPFPHPLKPLSDFAAFQMFVDIADDHHDRDSVQELLNLTSNLPLAVSLIANVVAYEGCDRTLSRWTKERTHLLSNGYDQKSNLDISIMLSYSSSRMTSGAQELLSLLSLLPDGLSDAELIQSALPIKNILSCKSTLIQVSLAYVEKTGNTQYLKSLVPVQEYIRRTHPPSPPMKYILRKHLHQILCIRNNDHFGVVPQHLQRIKNIVGNCHSILSDALSTECPDMPDIITSVINFHILMRYTGSGGSMLMHLIRSSVLAQPNEVDYGRYIMEMLITPKMTREAPKIEADIEMGSRFFKHAPEEEQAKWEYCLGRFYGRRNNFRQALEHYRLAVLHTKNHTNPMYSRILLSTCQAELAMGQYSPALKLAHASKQITTLCGDIHGQAFATINESRCQAGLGNLIRAKALARDALELFPTEIRRIEEEILVHLLMLKTEYVEARAMTLGILEYRASCKPQIHDTLICHLNLAVIGIETSAELEVINHHLDAARIQCTTFAYPVGLIHCDYLSANVHLRQGNISLAREMLMKCLLSYQDSGNIEGAQDCLARLADIQQGMCNHRDATRWAVILLSSGMTAKNRLVTGRALRCIGDIVAAEGDAETALSIFLAAFYGFMAMDIHRDKAQCMVGMAAIYEQRREMEQSIKLWQEARPLFEQSSQVNNVTQVDEKLQSYAKTQGHSKEEDSMALQYQSVI